MKLLQLGIHNLREEVNEPLYFHQFMERPSAKGSRFTADLIHDLAIMGNDSARPKPYSAGRTGFVQERSDGD